MPFLKLSTNVTIDQSQSEQLLSELSQLLAKDTGKPERYVMVELAGGKAMLFGGNNQPLAYLECKSIGLSTTQAEALSASISRLLTATLPLTAERIYIEFSNCPAEFWGWTAQLLVSLTPMHYPLTAFSSCSANEAHFSQPFCFSWQEIYLYYAIMHISQSNRRAKDG